jgi:hypothetical protein
MKNKHLFYTLIPLLVVSLFFLNTLKGSAQQSAIDHIIITEIQVASENGTTDEYVEIFNPTNNSVNLENWKIYKLTKTNTTTQHILLQFPTQTNIKPQTYLLLAHQNYSSTSTVADFIFADGETISNDNTIVLENSNDEIIDMVGYGNASVFETVVAPAPTANKNILRIFTQNDYQDTNNNSTDFIKNNPEPQNNFYIPPPPNIAPIAIFNANTTSTLINNEIYFDATSSTDDKEIILYKWDFDDGNFDTNSTTTHSYSVSGEFLVTLSVTDSENKTATTSLYIFVNEPEIEIIEAPAQIKINELLPNPESGNEWVEFYNPTTSTINLDGWLLADNSSTGTLSGTINSLGFFVYEFSNAKLNNNGDVLTLFTPNLEKIDDVFYGDFGGSVAPAKGHSLARLANGQDSDNNVQDFAETTTPTKESSNIITREIEIQAPAPIYYSAPSTNTQTEQTDTGKIVINEFLPNPTGSDTENEFIELFNADTKTINLNGWQLNDESAKRFTFENKILKSGEYITVYRSESGIALNNTGGETVKLYNANVSLVDSINYNEKAKDNYSYNRGEDGWFWSEDITPNNANAKPMEKIVVLTIDTLKEAKTNELIKFDASDSQNIDTDFQFEWDFGDGTTSTEIFIEHSFEYADLFIIKLKAKNSEGEEYLQTTEINITEKEEVVVEDTIAFPIDWKFLQITEIFPNPAGADDDEFIEIYNPANYSLDISGLKIDDAEGGSKSYVVPKNTIIPANSFKVFWKADTKIALNNTGDAVRLLYPDNSVLTEKNYEKTTEDASLAFSNGIWTWTTSPTPGTYNQIYSIVQNKKIATQKIILNLPLTKIAEADIGDQIKTQGIIAVLPGILSTQYFYIIDKSGIQVYMNNKDFPDLKLGDLIQVTGEISKAYGEMRIKIKNKEDIQILNNSGLPEPKIVEIAEINEDLKTKFIQIAGEITEIRGSYMYIDDGSEEIKVYFKKGTEIDKKQLKIGGLVTVTGIVGKTTGGFQLLPRAQQDIVKTGVSEFAIQDEQAYNQDVIINESGPIEKYLTATAGGITSIIFGLFAHSKRKHFGTLASKLAGLIKNKV